MIVTSEIEDRNTLKDWLRQEDLSRESCVALANRAAMRAAPLYWCGVAPLSRNLDLTAVPVQRSLLISAVAAVRPTADIRKAAHAAYIALAADSAALAAAEYAIADGVLGGDFAATAVALAALAVADSAAATADSAALAADSAALAADSAIGVAAIPNSAAATAAMWAVVQADCDFLIGDGKANTDFRRPLWPDRRNPLSQYWERTRAGWQAAGPDWQFWIDWYEDALAGRPPNWDMLQDIATQITNDDWEVGSERVNGLIAEIKKRYPSILPRPAAETIREAIGRNLETLPAQIEALLLVIEEEVERLRGKNPEGEIEAEDIRRMKGIFEKMHSVLTSLAERLPLEGAPEMNDAAEIAGLFWLFVEEFQKWPRENAADLVDSTIRVTFVGLTAGLMAAVGAPWLAGVAAGGVIFGGKRIAEIKNAAKGLSDGS